MQLIKIWLKDDAITYCLHFACLLLKMLESTTAMTIASFNLYTSCKSAFWFLKTRWQALSTLLRGRRRWNRHHFSAQKILFCCNSTFKILKMFLAFFAIAQRKNKPEEDRQKWHIHWLIYWLRIFRCSVI